VKYDTIGIRRGARAADRQHAVIRVALRGGEGDRRDVGDRRGSTDSNLAMSMGIAAMTIGGGKGGNAHAAGEWYDDGPTGYKGPQWGALIVASLAGLARTTTP